MKPASAHARAVALPRLPKQRRRRRLHSNAARLALAVTCALIAFFLLQLRAADTVPQTSERAEKPPHNASAPRHVPPTHLVVVIVPPFSAAHNLPALFALLKSVVDADYPLVSVGLRIVLAPEHEQLRKVVGQITAAWSRGPLQVVAGGAAPYALYVNAWQPTEGQGEDGGGAPWAAFIDAALVRTVRTTWFTYLMHAHSRYAHISDIDAMSPVPAAIRSLNGSTPWYPQAKEDGRASDHVYLYGSAAYIGVWSATDGDRWRRFQMWFSSYRSHHFLWPGVVPRGWHDKAWANFDGQRYAHWSVWYTRYLAEHQLYVLHPRSVLNDLPQIDAPLESLTRIEYNGAVEPNVMRADAAESDASKSELDELVALARAGDGSVAITIVTEAFLDMALSWACNVAVGGFKPKTLVWITPDDSYERLSKIEGTRAIRMRSFRSGGGAQGAHWNSPGYWLLMLERTQLIRDLLERGVAVFAFETDQVWLRDPMPDIRRLAGAADIVGTIDTNHHIAGNFLYIVPTPMSRLMWRGVARRFRKAFVEGNMHRPDAPHRGIMNDQTLQTKIVFYDRQFANHHGITFRALDTIRFVDGRWYEGKKYYGDEAQSPTMINNNFIKGIDAKMDRAKKFHHWFWDGAKCDTNAVSNAIAENDARAASTRRRPDGDYDVGFQKSMQAVSKSHPWRK